jgi:hypothetical protein
MCMHAEHAVVAALLGAQLGSKFQHQPACLEGPCSVRVKGDDHRLPHMSAHTYTHH